MTCPAPTWATAPAIALFVAAVLVWAGGIGG